MRVALVTMDLLVVPVPLDSRENVVRLDLLVPWESLVLPDLLGQLELLADLETVESRVHKVPLDLLAPLELEAPLDLRDPVVRREVLEKREREA